MVAEYCDIRVYDLLTVCNLGTVFLYLIVLLAKLTVYYLCILHNLGSKHNLQFLGHHIFLFKQIAIAQRNQIAVAVTHDAVFIDCGILRLA